MSALVLQAGTLSGRSSIGTAGMRPSESQVKDGESQLQTRVTIFPRHVSMGLMMTQTRSPGIEYLPGQMELPVAGPDMRLVTRLRSKAPMRASVAQKPCDVGLFDDTQTQIDLEEMLG